MTCIVRLTDSLPLRPYRPCQIIGRADNRRRTDEVYTIMQRTLNTPQRARLTRCRLISFAGDLPVASTLPYGVRIAGALMHLDAIVNDHY